MDNIIHYKSVKECFTKEINENVEIFDDFPDLELNEGIGVTHNYTKQKKIIPLDVLGLKKAMSDNETVSIERQTLIVSEDVNKNTIMFKHYHFRKKLVSVKNLKRKKFKIITSVLCGISINKNTGDYYVYKINRLKRGSKTIRHNIMSDGIKIHLNTLISIFDKKSTNEAQSIFYNLLGYKPILNYVEFIRYYLNPNKNINIDPREKKNSIIIFPFLNYLIKQNIKLPEYHELHLFEKLFKRNKKQFINNGSTIFDIIKKYYDINDDNLINIALNQMSDTAISHYRNGLEHVVRDMAKYPNRTISSSFNHLFLNELIFNLFKNGLYDSKSLDKNKLNQIDFITIGNKSNKIFKKYQYIILELYKFDIVELSKINPEDLFLIIRKLYYFYQFNIKIKLNTINDDILYDNILNKIFDVMQDLIRER